MITKQDALAKLDASDEAAYKALTVRVDAALPRFNGSAITIDIDSIPRKAVDRVIADGRAAGWTVERYDDQRDGSFLSFK